MQFHLLCRQCPPAERYLYGTSCTSYPNVCGQTSSGTYDCNGMCSASAPALPAAYGSLCTSSANSCGDVNYGYIQCDGSCSASARPAERWLYGTSCTLTSLPNACGQTTSATGTYNCTYACTATRPPPPTNSGCAPTTPTISGPYKNSLLRPPSVLVDPQGYELRAQAVSPANFSLTYYFEWSKDGVNWTGDPNPPAGTWAGMR